MTTRSEYTKKYQLKRDAIMLRPSKEDGAKVRAAAAAAGMSVQAFVMRAVNESIKTHGLEAMISAVVKNYDS